MDFRDSIAAASSQATAALLAEIDPSGHWVGELATSALSTATAVCALRIVLAAPERNALLSDEARLGATVQNGQAWLAAHANPDGGWGDTVLSLSNLSTTTLVWAALGDTLPSAPGRSTPTNPIAGLPMVLERAEHWIAAKAGGLEPRLLASAIIARYGKDRTFSVPILTLCALMGRLGQGAQAWRQVIPLPFELAAFPASWFAALRLPVVSYALPALIAIGYARHYHAPSANPLSRFFRGQATPRTLAKLKGLQPENGGFLEATPLTSFVVLSLAGSGQIAHPVVLKGVDFLLASQRADGSWPIDTNLATWLTTLAVNALPARNALSAPAKEKIRQWLLQQQYRARHPYTQAAPGGWAWTDLPGGVPDADDTAGALLALKNLGVDTASLPQVFQGIGWLLAAQNRDGGIPTFCRGWGTLPFDRSSADITAHAIRAWLAWKPMVNGPLAQRLEKGLASAIRFLAQEQHAEGYWRPLWFGNQHRSDESNPVYGTARVVAALGECARQGIQTASPALARGLQWLIAAQKAEGSWGADRRTPASIEETALAVEAIAVCLHGLDTSLDPTLRDQAEKAAGLGAHWLAEQVARGAYRQPSPIGFYFSNLWYYEKLYPIIFTAGAFHACQSR